MRIVFFGTPAFAVPTFQALRRERYQVVGVVTQPDRAQGVELSFRELERDIL